MRNLIFTAVLTVIASPALAGGWTGGNDSNASGAIAACAELAGQHVPQGTSCVDENGVVVVASVEIPAGTVIEVRRGLFCPYPYRRSDSVFVGGSGYLLKDTVRARLGCL